MEKVIINGIAGRVFQGEWPDTLCFVPEAALEDDGKRLNREVYVGQKFGLLNFVANNHVSVGESLFPDLSQPVVEGSTRLTAFLLRLEGGAGKPKSALPRFKDKSVDDFAAAALRRRKGRADR